MVDITDKIIKYREISTILLLLGILFLIVAVVLFFRFRIYHVISKLTGYDKKHHRDGKKTVKKESLEEIKEEKAENEDDEISDEDEDRETDLLQAEQDEQDEQDEQGEQEQADHFAETGLLRKPETMADGFEIIREIFLTEGELGKR